MPSTDFSHIVKWYELYINQEMFQTINSLNSNKTVGFTSSNLEVHSVKDGISHINIIINVYIQLEKNDPENILVFEGTK